MYATVLSLPLAASVVEAVPAAHAASVQCGVDYRTNDWGSGFTAALTLTNRGSAAIDGWTLTYAYAGNQQLSSGWSGTWAQAAKTVTVKAADWNKTIAAGAAVTTGAQFTYSGTNTAPTAFAVNGIPCTGAHQPPVTVLTSPAPGATYTAGDPVPLAAALVGERPVLVLDEPT
ncbi:cellulose binding domain-containing protein, partial [Streptomyces hundungensis]